MVAKREEATGLDLFSFLQPFDWQVWLLTVLTMIIAGFVYQWMEWINDDSDRQHLQDKPTETIYFAALSFNGDIKFEPSTDYARAFVLTLAFWGLILSSAYTANLASFLVSQNVPRLDIETVGDAVARNIPMCVTQGTAQETEIEQAYPQARLIRVPAKDPNLMFTYVLNGRCTVALTPMFYWDLVKRSRTSNIDCQLQWIGRTFRFMKSGYATRSDSGTLCTSLIRDVLSAHITAMADEGVIDRIEQEYLRSIQTIECNGNSAIPFSSGSMENNDGDAGFVGVESASENGDSGGDDQQIQSLSLNDLGGLFIILYCTGAASCVAALLSWYRKIGPRRLRKEASTILETNAHDLELKVKDPSTHGHGEAEVRLATNGADATNNMDSINDREYLARKVERMRQELEEIHSLLSRQS
jgi:hypothetical protein